MFSDEPGAPRNLRVTEYWTDYVSLAWDAPESDGGSEITGYIIGEFLRGCTKEATSNICLVK